MTRQEEIREELRDLLLHIHINKELTIDDLTDSVLKHLHSQGVVIKVDDSSYVAPCLRDSWEEIKQDMKEAGYVAVEPLIK